MNCGLHRELRASRGPSQPFAHRGLISVYFIWHSLSCFLQAAVNEHLLRGAFLLHPRAIFTSFQVAFEMKTEKGRSQVVAVVTLMMLIAAAEEFFSKGEKQDEAKAGIYLQHHTAHAPS